MIIHSKGEWEKLIKEFQESGLSQHKWCAIHGENRKMLQYWISRLEYLKLGKDVVFAEGVIGGAMILTLPRKVYIYPSNYDIIKMLILKNTKNYTFCTKKVLEFVFFLCYNKIKLYKSRRCMVYG